MARQNRGPVADNWNILAGCTLVGLGIGVAAGSAGAGILIGAGIGFLATFITTWL
jgi:hypothetical protein